MIIEIGLKDEVEYQDDPKALWNNLQALKGLQMLFGWNGSSRFSQKSQLGHLMVYLPSQF